MRLIDADEVMRDTEHISAFRHGLANLSDLAIALSGWDEVTPIKADPVRHGRWEPMLDRVWNLPNPVLSGWRCSECGRTENEKEPYCNCGAKMDKED